MVCLCKESVHVFVYVCMCLCVCVCLVWVWLCLSISLKRSYVSSLRVQLHLKRQLLYLYRSSRRTGREHPRQKWRITNRSNSIVPFHFINILSFSSYIQSCSSSRPSRERFSVEKNCFLPNCKTRGRTGVAVWDQRTKFLTKFTARYSIKYL